MLGCPGWEGSALEAACPGQRASAAAVGASAAGGGGGGGGGRAAWNETVILQRADDAHRKALLGVAEAQREGRAPVPVA